MTIQNGDSGAVQNTDTSTTDDGTSFGSSMTDLLPPELVAAVNKGKEDTKAAAAKEASIPPPAKETSATDIVKDITQSTDTGDDLKNVSTDNIDDLIAGKVTAKADDAPETPDWHETPEYKDLIKKVGFVNGIKNEDFDKAIKAVLDKKVIETSTYTNGLEEKITKAKQTEEGLKEEVSRLKNIEKDAFFDNLEETKEKFATPMNNAATQLKQVLDINGSTVSLNKVLLAKNITEFNNLLKDQGLDEKDLDSARSLWRSYNDLHRDYKASKEDARSSLKNHMSSNIPEETVKKIMGNTIADAMKKDPRFDYIKNGISQDEYPEEVTKVLGRAHQNFANITQALSNPHDSARNSTWLGQLAAFTLDAAHNANEAAKLPDVISKLAAKEEDMKKLVVAFTKLRDSNKGINGSNGIARMNGSSNGTADDKTSRDQKAADLKKIIDGTGDVEKFMGFK